MNVCVQMGECDKLKSAKSMMNEMQFGQVTVSQASGEPKAVASELAL